MVKLITLPGYAPSPLLDLSQINQALDRQRQQANLEAKMAAAARQEVEQKRQFDLGNERGDKKFALQEAQAQREAAMDPLRQRQIETAIKMQERELNTPTNKTMIIPAGGTLATADPRNPGNFNILHTAPKPMDTTSKKAVWEAQDEIPNIKSTLEAFDEMKTLVPNAYHGFGSTTRAAINEGLPAWMPNVISNPDSAKATTRLNTLLSEQAINAMSAALKGATTDTEMMAFRAMIANPNISADNKKKTIDSMKLRAERHMAGKVDRIRELGGTVPDYAPVQLEPKLQDRAPGAPVQIKGVDDYNKLQPGTPYIDPNGVERIKGQRGTN